MTSHMLVLSKFLVLHVRMQHVCSRSALGSNTCQVGVGACVCNHSLLSIGRSHQLIGMSGGCPGWFLRIPGSLGVDTGVYGKASVVG